MAEAGTAGRTPIGAILAIAGGALLGIGSFLAWAEVSGGGTSVTAKGIDGSDGYITLGAGGVALLVGVVQIRQTRRALAIIAIVAGLVGGGVAVYDALTAKDSVLDSAAEELAPAVGASPERVRELLDQAIDAGQLSISLSTGIYVVIVGGMLALVGGIMSLERARSREAEAVAGAPPPVPSIADPAAPPSPAPPTDQGSS